MGLVPITNTKAAGSLIMSDAAQYKEISATPKKSSGFTMIELMIVVAIIGILASIAIPAYQDYTARAQSTEALKVSYALQTDLAIYVAENNSFAGVDTDPAITALAANLDGKYVSGVTVAADGSINVPFDNGALAGQTFTLQPVLNGSQIARWTCAGLANTQHLPTGCR
jgi:type IV pilus assembly protein PilA